MNELEHVRDFLDRYQGNTVEEVNRLYEAYRALLADRPKLTQRTLVKRLIGLGAYKRRSNGQTIVDFTGLA